MTNGTRLLLGDTSGLMEATGEPLRVDGPWRPLDAVLTVSVSVAGFFGRVLLEGSLDEGPADDSWFPIRLSTDPEGALLFPLPEDVATGTTGTFAFSFRARLIWLRARMDRENVVPPPDPDEIDRVGIVRHVLLVR